MDEDRCSPGWSNILDPGEENLWKLLLVSSSHLQCLSRLHLTCSQTCVAQNGQGTGNSPSREPRELASPHTHNSRPRQGIYRQGWEFFPSRAHRHFLHSSSLHRPAPWGLILQGLSHPIPLCVPGPHLGFNTPRSTGLVSPSLRASLLFHLFSFCVSRFLGQEPDRTGQ